MRTGKAVTAILLGGMLTGQVWAQSNLDRLQIPSGVSTIPVELLPPGARALGLAGAFTAVADDATAAEANPAGLTILSAPELSLHFRSSDYDIEFYDAEARNGELFGGPTGTLLKNYEDSQDNVAFASVVYPWDRFVFSAFYTNNLDIRTSAATDSVFDPNFVDGFISDNALSGEVEAFGLSTAFRINDLISLGVTIKRSELSLRTLDQMVFEDFLDAEFAFAQEIGQATPAEWANVIDDVITVSSNLDGDDSATTFNVGLLLNPAGNFSAGLVYKKGGEFDINGAGTFTRQLTCNGSGLLFDICQQGLTGLPPEANSTMVNQFTRTVDLPDTLTLGLAWRPGADDTWLLSFDIANIDYSDLPPPRRTTLGLELPVDGSPMAIANDIERIGDAVTYHFGIEKVLFPESISWLTAVTLRGGAFTDDDHDGTRLTNSDDTHGTLGIGAVIGTNFQIDLAGEFSDRVDNVVLSAIYRFD